jgi:hypothetical protein
MAPRGIPSRKLALAVDDDVHERLIAAAAEDGVSISAWITKVLLRALMVRDGLSAIADWENEQGWFSEAELEAARRRVGNEIVGASTSPMSREEALTMRGANAIGDVPSDSDPVSS